MRTALPLLLVVLLTACASVPESPPARDAGAAVLAQLLTGLPGDYSTATGGDNGNRVLRLAVRAESTSAQGEAQFSLTQFENGLAPRRFLLQLSAGQRADELRGRFAPQGADGRIQAYCDLRFVVRADGIAGRSDPSECQFGSGEAAAGLLKELAFDGTQLVIGDRLVHLASGEAVIPDQIHVFYPVRRFEGWAGRREHGAWRRSAAFMLESAGDLAEPRDAAGMSLDLLIELNRHDLGDGNRPILRMTVRDLDGEQVLAESWADSDAEQLGLALPDLQIGLQVQGR